MKLLCVLKIRETSLTIQQKTSSFQA